MIHYHVELDKDKYISLLSYRVLNSYTYKRPQNKAEL